MKVGTEIHNSCMGQWVSDSDPLTHMTHLKLMTHLTHDALTHCQLCLGLHSPRSLNCAALIYLLAGVKARMSPLPDGR